MVPFLIPVLVAAAGGLVAYVLMRRHGWTPASSVAWALVAAPGVGFGLISVVFFFWVFAGWPPPSRWLLAVLTLILAAAFAAPVFARAERSPADGKGQPAAKRRAALLAGGALAALGLGLLLSMFPRFIATQPYGSWDAKAIWNVRALFLYRASGDLDEIYSGLEYGHPDYPLLLPASIAGQYCLLGREDLAIPPMTSMLFTVAAGIALFMAVARTGRPMVAGVAAAVYWATPAVWRWAFNQYADIPLSYFLLMAVLTLASQLDTNPARRLPPVLAGLFLSLLAWTKNEGTVQAILVAAAFFVLWALQKRVGWWRRPLWVVAGALPVSTALVLFKTHWSPVNETVRFLGGGVDKLLAHERWLTVARAYWSELAPWSGAATWGLLWTALALCAVGFRRHRVAGGRPQQLAGAVLLLTFGLTIMAYILTPVAGLQWHLDTSLKRLLLQLTPLAMAWAVAGVGGEPLRGRARSPT